MASNKLTPVEARKIAQSSTAAFERQMSEVYAAIRAAAGEGKFEIPFPNIMDEDVRRRVAEQLAIEKYIIMTPADHVFDVIKW